MLILTFLIITKEKMCVKVWLEEHDKDAFDNRFFPNMYEV